MSLAQLLKSYFSVDKAHPCSNGEFFFKKETAIMANLETFEYSPQTETYETGWGAETEWGGEAEVFSEAETMELAGELTEITTEAELDRFLGDLISKAGRALGKVVRSPIGQAVGGWLKGAAKSALPLAGGALGGLVGGPLGAKIGSGLASAAGSALGLPANPAAPADGCAKAETSSSSTADGALAGPAEGVMRDFNPRPELRPDAFEFSGAPNGGSFVRSRPRRPFSNAEENELALELLQLTSGTEFERFVGGLFKKAWRGIEPVGSKVTGPLGGLLKAVAEKALPSVVTAAGTSFGGPAGDAIAEKLGSLVSQALEAEVAGMAATDPDLEKCRQLFEKYRQFVRLAGKAATAAASAPTGVSPVVAAQKSLAQAANEKLTRKAASAGLAGNFAEGASAAAAMKTAAASDRAAGQRSRTTTQAPGGRTCSICELPPGSCRCRKIGRSGRWLRSGSSIIVNC